LGTHEAQSAYELRLQRARCRDGNLVRDSVHVDWYVSQDGNLQHYWLEQRLGEHREDFEAPYGAKSLSLICDSIRPAGADSYR
jgi:hypothetical protein